MFSWSTLQYMNIYKCTVSISSIVSWSQCNQEDNSLKYAGFNPNSLWLTLVSLEGHPKVLPIGRKLASLLETHHYNHMKAWILKYYNCRQRRTTTVWDKIEKVMNRPFFVIVFWSFLQQVQTSLGRVTIRAFSKLPKMSGFWLCFPVVFILAEGNAWKVVWPIHVGIVHNWPIMACEKVGSTENGQSNANMHK